VNKTVASVIDDINEWQGPHGSVFYVTAIFTDESVGSAGRKDHDAALEVQGLLREAIGQELDYVLEPKGQTKTGRDKFKILGFGTPGGAATYTAPGIQGGGGPSNAAQGPARGRSPEPSSEQASIRASVALKAAVEFGVPRADDINGVLEHADVFNAWLLEKTSVGEGRGSNETQSQVVPVVSPTGETSEPALSAYPSTDSPSVTPAGAGSETTSPPSKASAPSQGPQERMSVAPAAGGESSDSAGVSEPTRAESESGGGVVADASASLGKEPAPPPRTIDGVPTHLHDWQPHPNLHGWLMCSCGENRKKYAP
jgi:hypothetical protein